MKVLYEILVPTIYGDTLKPIRTAHHKNWDAFVQKITGGLTILKPAKGRWLDNGVEYPERVIPVRVMCEEKVKHNEFVASNGKTIMYDTNQIDAIIQFTLSHYRQKAVMYYVVSNDVKIVYSK